MSRARTDENRAVCNIAILLLGTGCRLNEILLLKKSDIDVENRVLKISLIVATYLSVKQQFSTYIMTTRKQMLQLVQSAMPGKSRYTTKGLVR